MNLAVYRVINAIQRDFSESGGISKDRKNATQGYAFRGIDDVYNALSPLLAKHGLVIIPRHLVRSCDERINAKGTALFYVQVESEFDLVAVEDGSIHVAKSFGEAMDSGDKATNKAMSAAYKYMAMQVFAIPTEGDNDSDGSSHTAQPTSVGKLMLLGAVECKALSAEQIKNAAASLGIDPNNSTKEQARSIIAKIQE
jgi:ERF superfamily